MAARRPSRPKRLRGHQPTLQLVDGAAQQVAAAEASTKSAQPAVRLAFEFLVLTAARSGEVRLATWDEIDPAGAVCTISAARMKAKREHRVPLCGRALEILDAARALGDGPRRLVFPMRSGKPIATSTLPKMLQYHEIAAVPHGFRSSFRDWPAEETDHLREVIEARRSRTWSRTRSRPPMRGQTCSSADGGSWSTGPATLSGHGAS